MNPTPEYIDELYREEVHEAQRMAPERKMAAGGELFDELCERMRDGIRYQYPGADEAQVEAILRERLELARRLEEAT